jgi:hypothetical protein
MLLLGVISEIKQNSSDMNEIILAPCDAGYVQNCTGFLVNLGHDSAEKLTQEMRVFSFLKSTNQKTPTFYIWS